jgi:hypothetical protein
MPGGQIRGVLGNLGHHQNQIDSRARHGAERQLAAEDANPWRRRRLARGAWSHWDEDLRRAVAPRQATTRPPRNRLIAGRALQLVLARYRGRPFDAHSRLDSRHPAGECRRRLWLSGQDTKLAIEERAETVPVGSSCTCSVVTISLHELDPMGFG